MKLTEIQLQSALKKINEAGNRPCPFCGKHTTFRFNPSSSEIMNMEAIKTVMSAGYYDSIPVLTASCNSCGYMLQFNLNFLLQDLK